MSFEFFMSFESVFLRNYKLIEELISSSPSSFFFPIQCRSSYVFQRFPLYHQYLLIRDISTTDRQRRSRIPSDISSRIDLTR